MKTTIALAIASLCATMASSMGFTLDFVGYEGTTLPPNPLIINVPGYGDVRFDAANGSTLQVDNAYQNDNGSAAPSLSFDQGEAIQVTFLGAQPLNVDFDFVGVSAGESFTVQPDLFKSQSFLINLQGSGDGAGLYAISWTQVPEPASAMLGVLGSALIVLRRRR
ncbi:PEP-CTERM sorting domain-containing protein [Luteolibacter ambystomatis]|uniref:PEP-CTERM sorting domain-containing protein n=1 Tax=Luteolibacter ambystomatis TaxID=2824561 RepID=A0A975J121_9BACT|nr:PEP-CTERM sorting domain-containing protein [Luteolibacter ambystomatis]QUE52072.1 PEP-CTERM sorting domain-containing protein [Luteolibacter ambystomatis]